MLVTEYTNSSKIDFNRHSSNSGVIDIQENTKALKRDIERIEKEGFYETDLPGPTLDNKDGKFTPLSYYTNEAKGKPSLGQTLARPEAETLEWQDSLKFDNGGVFFTKTDKPGVFSKMQHPQVGSFLEPFRLWTLLKRNTGEKAKELFAQLPDLYERLANQLEERILKPNTESLSIATPEKQQLWAKGLASMFKSQKYDTATQALPAGVNEVLRLAA